VWQVVGVAMKTGMGGWWRVAIEEGTKGSIDWGAFQAARLHPQVNNDFYTVGESTLRGSVVLTVTDVLQPLPWPDNSFGTSSPVDTRPHPPTDLIHVKSMLMDVPQYPDLIGKLARVLRPGGMLILVETELRFVSKPHNATIPCVWTHDLPDSSTASRARHPRR
jgi:hypothetical protein